MVVNLPEIIGKDVVYNERDPGLLFLNGDPSFITSTLLVFGDPNLEKYLGRLQLEDAREKLCHRDRHLVRDASGNNIAGYFALESADGALRTGREIGVYESPHCGITQKILELLQFKERRSLLELNPAIFEGNNVRANCFVDPDAEIGLGFPPYVFLNADHVDYVRALNAGNLEAKFVFPRIGSMVCYELGGKLTALFGPYNPAVFMTNAKTFKPQFKDKITL